MAARAELMLPNWPRPRTSGSALSTPQDRELTHLVTWGLPAAERWLLAQQRPRDATRAVLQACPRRLGAKFLGQFLGAVLGGQLMPVRCRVRVRLIPSIPRSSSGCGSLARAGLGGATAHNQSVDDAKPQAEGAKNDEHNQHALRVKAAKQHLIGLAEK